MPYTDFAQRTLPPFRRAYYKNVQKAAYRVLVGARGTGKSTFAADEAVMKLLNDKWRNIVFVRLNDTDNADSCFKEVSKAIRRFFGNDERIVQRYWWFRTQPLRITYRPTGQEIMFKGFNNATNVTSITAATGYVSDIYIEEASQISNMQDFILLDGSLRAPDDFPIQITFLLNPWDVNSWICQVFCKGRLDEDIDYMEKYGFQDRYYPDFLYPDGFTHKGLYLNRTASTINPYLPSVQREAMQMAKDHAPLIYATNYMGLWGNTMGGTYPEFDRSKNIVPLKSVLEHEWFSYCCIGIDTGMSDGQGKVRKDDRIKSATVAEFTALTQDFNKIYALEEWYWTNEGKSKDQEKTPTQMLEDIVDWLAYLRRAYAQYSVLMKGMVNVFVDNADKASLSMLQAICRRKGVQGFLFQPSTKISIFSRVDFSRMLLAYRNMMMTEKCPNLAREMSASRKGQKGEARENLDDHALNAWEYSWYPYTGRMRAWADFKEH